MGMFSYDCKVCGRSMRRAWGGPEDPEAWRADVVCVPAQGDPMIGTYDGYGCIGGIVIPWLEGVEEVEEVREALAMSRRYAADMRRVDDVLVELNAALAAAGRATVPHDGVAEAARMIEEDEAALADAEARVVRFTVYHRRCWEGAGRPGFDGQSPRSRDQGA